MAHFAKVVDGVVTQVIVAEQDFMDSYVDTTPGTWIQTSYNTYGGVHSDGGTPLRYNFAGTGMLYDETADAFYEPKPYEGWTLNTSTYIWEPPEDFPDDGQTYAWDNDTEAWVVVDGQE